MVSTWRCFVLIEVSEDKKYKYQYDLLVICKKKQTAVNLQSNPEDHRDATS